MYCPACGAQNPPAARFCEGCGAAVAQAPPSAVPAASPFAMPMPMAPQILQVPQMPPVAQMPVAQQARPASHGGLVALVALLLVVLAAGGAGAAWWFWLRERAPAYDEYAGEWIVVAGPNASTASESSRRFRLWVEGARVRGVAGNDEGTFDLAPAGDGSLQGVLQASGDSNAVTMVLSADRKRIDLTIVSTDGSQRVTASAERYAPGQPQSPSPAAVPTAPPVAPPPVPEGPMAVLRPALVSENPTSG